MDASNNDGEPLLRDIIERMNKDENSPKHRALRVHAFLCTHPNLTNWDLICFCAEYIGSQAAVMDWLLPPAKDLIRAVYTAHYVRFENVEWTDKQPIYTDRASEMTELDSTGGP